MQRTTPTSSSTPTFPPFSVGVFTNPSSLSRPATRDGSIDPLHHPPPHSPPPIPTSSSAHPKESRKSSFSRKSSLSGSTRRRGSSVGSTGTSNAIVTDAAAPPALPDYALPAAAKVQSRDRRDIGSVDDGIRSPVSPTGGGSGFGSMGRTNTGGYFPPPTPIGVNSVLNGGASTMWQPSEASMIHQQIIDVASKRISTLDYLRKAYVCDQKPRPDTVH